MWEYNYTDYNNDYLAHHGVKGMRWGVITSKYEPKKDFGGNRLLTDDRSDSNTTNRASYSMRSKPNSTNRAVSNNIKSKSSINNGSYLNKFYSEMEDRYDKNKFARAASALTKDGRFKESNVPGYMFRHETSRGSGKDKVYVNIGVKDHSIEYMREINANELLDKLDNYEKDRELYMSLLKEKLVSEGGESYANRTLKGYTYNVENLDYDPKTKTYTFSIGNLLGNAATQKVTFTESDIKKKRA